MKPELDFTISTICEYDVTVQTIGAVLQLASKYKFTWNTGAVSGYNRAKNSKWTQFLKENKSPYLINIDRDMVFTTHDVDLIIEDLKDGYDLVGAAYTTHNGKQLTAWGLDGEGIVLNEKIYEVLYMSQGFCGISRRLLQKLVDELHLPLLNEGTNLEQYPFCMDAMSNEKICGNIWLSEDYYFCNQCRKVGVVPMLDTRLHIGHAAGMVWYPEHADAFQGSTGKVNNMKAFW